MSSCPSAGPDAAQRRALEDSIQREAARELRQMAIDEVETRSKGCQTTPSWIGAVAGLAVPKSQPRPGPLRVAKAELRRQQRQQQQRPQQQDQQRRSRSPLPRSR